LDADLNKDERIDADELLKTLYDIFFVILELELAKRNPESMKENDMLKKYDCLKDNKDLKELLDTVANTEKMEGIRDFTMYFYDTEKKGSLDHD